MLMKKLRWLLELFVLVLLSLPLVILPWRIALKTGEMLGLLLYLVWGSRRKVAVENIRRSAECGALKINGPAESIARKSFMNLGKSFVEVMKIYYGFGDRLIQNIDVTGIENFLNAKAKNRGVIIITGHCSNWELCALGFGVKVHKAIGVARTQDNPYLNKIIERIRTGYGNASIYKKGALKNILSFLRKGEVVGMLIDQAVVADEGYIIDFLGRDAWTIKAPALIARKTGAPVVPAFIHRSGNRYVLTVHPEVSLSEAENTEQAVIEDTKKFSACIEDYVRQHPAEWLWIHKRWKRTGQNRPKGNQPIIN